MAQDRNRVAVIDGSRTPFLRSGTAYIDMMGWELGRHAVKGLMAKTGVSGKDIDHVVFGSVCTDVATTNIAREILLGAGLPDTIPAHTCTVACISANMAATSAVDMILSGQAESVIAGGVETFSDPDIKISKKYRRFILDLTMFKRPKGLMGKLRLLKGMKFTDFIAPERPSINEYAVQHTMGDNADRIAKRLGITRAEQDQYAELSHQRALAAWKSGALKKEVVPVVPPGSAKAVDRDNGPRESATVEKLSKIKPAFDRRYGTVTAGNASFLTDGASAVLLMSEKKAKSLGLKPLAYIKTYAYTGQDLWTELLLGPAFSIPVALAKAKLKFSDIGVFEIHEAFGAQMVANIKCLGSEKFAKERLGLSRKIGDLDINKLNIYGGSLSLGHPFGATGGRLITTCANRLKESGEKYGIVAGCAGGAIGNTIILERA
ncbi:MAG: acetyl-CoA C-acyltransferase [Spirochaetes bacterium]|nr:acetyl-CoA C-acyltransferase [Spirochaetota bacterium]